MTRPLILAIDQGTTGSTVTINDFSKQSDPQVLARSTVNFEQHFPKTGWVEHDLDQIWASVREATENCFEALNGKYSPKDLAGIGVSNQRETLCVFDRKTSRPTRRAIVWQCKRSLDICLSLKKQGANETIHKKTGLFADPYFTGTKLTWVMENDSASAEALKSGSSVVGTIDTYLMHRLSGGEAHVTEASNASRTLLCDLKTGNWDDELIKLLKVPSQSILPEIKSSAGLFGKTKGLDFLPDGIPISGCLGDQQAALAGQTCFDAGEAKCTYGTGSFLLLNIGNQVKFSKANLLTTIAWKLDGKLTYAFEGAVFVSGAAVQFVRDQLTWVKSSAESQVLAESAKASPEIYFVPCLAGLGAPFWDPKARGAFLGLTRGTTKAQLVRATLEGMAFEVNELIQCMQKDLGTPMKSLRVDGGASANNLLMSLQSNFSSVSVDRPKNIETTAFGAALFAALGVGIFKNLDEAKGSRKVDREFHADSKDHATIEQQLAGWKRAVRAVQIFAGNEV